jgi:hypothetical protein
MSFQMEYHTKCAKLMEAMLPRISEPEVVESIMPSSDVQPEMDSNAISGPKPGISEPEVVESILTPGSNVQEETDDKAISGPSLVDDDDTSL